MPGDVLPIKAGNYLDFQLSEALDRQNNLTQINILDGLS